MNISDIIVKLFSLVTIRGVSVVVAGVCCIPVSLFGVCYIGDVCGYLKNVKKGLLVLSKNPVNHSQTNGINDYNWIEDSYLQFFS